MIVNDAHINLRLPAELLAALDSCAHAIGRTRSALLRALIEDVADSNELPTLPPTAQEHADAHLEQLRQLTIG